MVRAFRGAARGRLRVVLGLTVLGLVLVPGAAGAAQLDSVVVSGQTGPSFWPLFNGINITASSGPQGQDLSGNASFYWADGFVSGQVTCLNVTGGDHGVGAPGATTTAILNVRGYMIVYPGGPPPLEDFVIRVVDHGGSGLDTFDVGSPSAGGDCSGQGVSFVDTALNSTLSPGRAVVSDAPTVARFTAAPASSTTGTPVTFDASSSTCAAPPCSYAWTDGVAHLGLGAPLTFTFRYVGTKHVKLTITDAHGARSSVKHDLRVSRHPRATPSLHTWH